jgi:hypothetical protein
MRAQDKIRLDCPLTLWADMGIFQIATQILFLERALILLRQRLTGAQDQV